MQQHRLLWPRPWPKAPKRQASRNRPSRDGKRSSPSNAKRHRRGLHVTFTVPPPWLPETTNFPFTLVMPTGTTGKSSSMPSCNLSSISRAPSSAGVRSATRARKPGGSERTGQFTSLSLSPSAEVHCSARNKTRSGSSNERAKPAVARWSAVMTTAAIAGGTAHDGSPHIAHGFIATVTALFSASFQQPVQCAERSSARSAARLGSAPPPAG